MLVDLSIAIIQVTISVAYIQCEGSAALMQVIFSATNMWIKIFIAIMLVGVPAAITQMVFSDVHYVQDCFSCNYAVLTVSSNN